MQYYKCKCGQWSILGAVCPPQDCEGCDECGTTCASTPEGCKPRAPHTWVTKYDQNTGKPYQVCSKCHTKNEVEGTENTTVEFVKREIASWPAWKQEMAKQWVESMQVKPNE